MIEVARKTGVVLRNSPVPFAVIGPNGVHRQVLVKSDNAPLDLIVMDSEYRDDFLRSRRNSTLIYRLTKGFTVASHQNYVVKSGNVSMLSDIDKERIAYHYASQSSYDDRYSYMSFAWRGLLSEYDVQKINKHFSYTATDLRDALAMGSKADIEWTLAPLLAECRQLQEAYAAILVQRRTVYIATAAIYIAFFLLIMSKVLDHLPF